MAICYFWICYYFCTVFWLQQLWLHLFSREGLCICFRLMLYWRVEVGELLTAQSTWITITESLCNRPCEAENKHIPKKQGQDCSFSFFPVPVQIVLIDKIKKVKNTFISNLLNSCWKREYSGEKLNWVVLLIQGHKPDIIYIWFFSLLIYSPHVECRETEGLLAHTSIISPCFSKTFGKG